MNDSDLLKTKITIYAEADFEYLHSNVINKNSKNGCFYCFNLYQAYTKKDNLKRRNSFQRWFCDGNYCCVKTYQGSYKKVKQILLAEHEYEFGSFGPKEKFKTALKLKYVTIEDALRLNWDLIDERQVEQMIRSFPQLNPAIIKKIISYLNQNPDRPLDLSGITDITLNGIAQFDKLKTEINLNLDGLSKLTKEAALNLSKLKKLGSISLSGLKTFDLEDATHLVMNKRLNHISLDRLKTISTDVLFKLLINTNVTWIDLNHLNKITKGKLEFEKIDKKKYLSFFAMNHIDTVAGNFFSKLNEKTLLRLGKIDLAAVKDAKNLFSNSSCRLALDNVYIISDEAAFEVSKFKGTLEMSNLTLCTDFAIECFSKTSLSLNIKIDFLFEKTSACFINKKRNYISINKVKYINEAVAANLARANVKQLELSDLKNLSDYSAEILSKSKIEKIYIYGSCMTNKSVLEKFYSNRNPDGTKKETYEI